LLEAEGEADWLGLEEADADAEGFAGDAEAEADGMAEADAEGMAEAEADGIAEAEAEGMAEAEAEGLPPLLVISLSLSWAWVLTASRQHRRRTTLIQVFIGGRVTGVVLV
jgi:hypothetical protein